MKSGILRSERLFYSSHKLERFPSRTMKTWMARRLQLLWDLRSVSDAQSPAHRDNPPVCRTLRRLHYSSSLGNSSDLLPRRRQPRIEWPAFPRLNHSSALPHPSSQGNPNFIHPRVANATTSSVLDTPNTAVPLIVMCAILLLLPRSFALGHKIVSLEPSSEMAFPILLICFFSVIRSVFLTQLPLISYPSIRGPTAVHRYGSSLFTSSSPPRVPCFLTCCPALPPFLLFRRNHFLSLVCLA